MKVYYVIFWENLHVPKFLHLYIFAAKFPQVKNMARVKTKIRFVLNREIKIDAH